MPEICRTRTLLDPVVFMLKAGLSFYSECVFPSKSKIKIIHTLEKQKAFELTSQVKPQHSSILLSVRSIWSLKKKEEEMVS